MCNWNSRLDPNLAIFHEVEYEDKIEDDFIIDESTSIYFDQEDNEDNV